jgi:hypothetical protein
VLANGRQLPHEDPGPEGTSLAAIGHPEEESIHDDAEHTDVNVEEQTSSVEGEESISEEEESNGGPFNEIDDPELSDGSPMLGNILANIALVAIALVARSGDGGSSFCARVELTHDYLLFD